MTTFKQLLESNLDQKLFGEMDSSVKTQIQTFIEKRTHLSKEIKEYWKKFLNEEIRYGDFKKKLINNHYKDGEKLRKILF